MFLKKLIKKKDSMNKQLICIFLFLFFFNSGYSFNNKFFTKKKNNIEKILTELKIEISTIQIYYSDLKQIIYKKIKLINETLLIEIKLENKLNLLIKKDQLKEDLKFLELNEKSNINKIRYLKGLSIIRILYEKVLSLDHHFSSVATFSEINKIGNPNNYQDFNQVKDLISSKKNKKNAFKLTSLLTQNIYTSSIDILLNLFNSKENSKEKKIELQKIECILDFTLRMNKDLNTIYFETAFLQKSNEKIMQDLILLFKEYTKPIKYFIPLKKCRINDDWDVLRKNLNDYMKKIDKAIKKGDEQQKIMRMQIDLNFPIDRLLQFITQYNSFIDQGGKFYEKFKIIL